MVWHHTQKTLASLTLGISIAVFVTGCSQTAAPAPDIIQRIQGQTPAPPPPTGFLGNDYSLLKAATPGSGQEAMLAYINPSASFNSYNKVMIAPVTYWADGDSTLSSQDQQTLCDYFYNVLTEKFGKNLQWSVNLVPAWLN